MSGRSIVPVATVAVSLALAMSLVGSPAIASAATTEDQVQDVVDEMFCFQPYEFSACYNGAAQTVTAGTDGDLIAVSLVVDREAFTTHDLVVQIRSGDPFGAVLATSDSVAASDIPTSPNGDWVTFVFPAPATLQAGDVFAIVLPDMPMSPTSDPRWALGKASQDVYAGGVAFGGVMGTDWQEYEDGSDFAFATYMASGAPTCDLALSASGGQPVNELTAAVGDEVDLVGTDYAPIGGVIVEFSPPDGDPFQEFADTDVFGDFGGALVLEAADIGEWQIVATSDEDPDCTDTVALTVEAAAVSPPSPRATVPPTSTDMEPTVGGPSALWAIIATMMAGAGGWALASRRVARRRS